MQKGKNSVIYQAVLCSAVLGGSYQAEISSGEKNKEGTRNKEELSLTWKIVYNCQVYVKSNKYKYKYKYKEKKTQQEL